MCGACHLRPLSAWEPRGRAALYLSTEIWLPSLRACASLTPALSLIALFSFYFPSGWLGTLKSVLYTYRELANTNCDEPCCSFMLLTHKSKRAPSQSICSWVQRAEAIWCECQPRTPPHPCLPPTPCLAQRKSASHQPFTCSFIHWQHSVNFLSQTED